MVIKRYIHEVHIDFYMIERYPFQLYLPGSGIALELFQIVKDSQSSINVVVLSKFCEEGDNTRDGVELADYSNILMSWMSGTKYSVPHSWRLLFGAPAPSEMFW